MPRKKAVQDDTARERLIQAALAVFAKDGFDAATTRAIAARAKVNLAAIPYYFGTKEHLYHEAIMALVEFIESRFRAPREAIVAMLDQADLPRERLLSTLEALAVGMVDTVTGPEIRAYAPLVMREHMMPGPAFEIFYDRLMRHQHEMLTRLVARLLCVPEDSREAMIRAQMFFGQIFGFLVGRNLLVRRMGQEDYTPDDVAEIRRMVVEALRRLFPDPGESVPLKEGDA